MMLATRRIHQQLPPLRLRFEAWASASRREQLASWVKASKEIEPSHSSPQDFLTLLLMHLLWRNQAALHRWLGPFWRIPPSPRTSSCREMQEAEVEPGPPPNGQKEVWRVRIAVSKIRFSLMRAPKTAAAAPETSGR